MRSEAFRVEVGRPDEYARAKGLLDRGRHPTFVGREMLRRCARNGGLLFFVVGGVDAALALVSTRLNTLNVLCVHPDYRGGGLGGACLEYIKPNFARVVDFAVPWFGSRGYTAVGDWKQGRRHRTRLMVRSSLLTLTGRLRERIGHREEAETPLDGHGGNGRRARKNPRKKSRRVKAAAPKRVSASSLSDVHELHQADSDPAGS